MSVLCGRKIVTQTRVKLFLLLLKKELKFVTLKMGLIWLFIIPSKIPGPHVINLFLSIIYKFS